MLKLLRSKIKSRLKFYYIDKVFIIIPVKYSDSSNIFLIKKIIEFLKYIKINNNVIKLEKSKQLFFRFIYNLELVELKMLKTYIKTNLANGIIYFFISLIKAFIFYD